MSKSALERISSLPYLYESWGKMKSRTKRGSRHVEGFDRESIASFERRLEYNINLISANLRNRKYFLNYLKPFEIIKPNQEKRFICIPSVRDRLVQRSLLKFLSEKYKHLVSNKISYGFVEGGGVEKAINQACYYRKENNWVFKTDISSFFDCINRDHLIEIIKSKIRHRSLHRLLVDIVSCDVKQEKRLTRNGIKKGLGIRQGMPLSPFLSNLFLYDFDQAIIDFNLKAVRYADDLIFFAKSKEECEKIYNICFKELEKFGLTIPAISNTEESKTKIASPEDEIDFLGLSIKRNNGSYEPVVNEKQMRAIRTELGHLKDINTLNSKGVALHNLGTHINSKILGYKNAYKECKNKTDLYNMLDTKKIEIFEDVYNKLGIEIGKLSNSEKTFLGIN